MGTNVLEAFIITFGLDSKGFEDGSRRVEDDSKKLRENQKKLFDGIEDSGKRTGAAIKGLSREVIGLSLAFMGAKSITGLVSSMMTGAAKADYLGERIGVATARVYAWRKASQTMGGAPEEGDAALQAIQNAKMGYQMSGTTGNDMAFTRLGITGHDLQHGSADSILQKLAGAQGKMNPQLYSSLLQQIGLPASTINFLMKGKESVDSLIGEYAANTSEMENLAKEQEKLQQAITELQTTLANKIAPALTTIANWITRLMGEDPKIKSETAAMGAVGSIVTNYVKATGTGKTRADRNHNPGNIVDSPWTRKQPGYAGSDGRFAKFASPEHGFAAMEKLLANYMAQGRTSISSILSKYAPSSENDVGAYARHVSQMTGFSPNARLGREHIPMLARAMAKHEGYSFKTNTAFTGLAAMQRNIERFGSRGGGGNITVQNMTVNTQAKDGHAMLRDVSLATQRRAAVAQSDRVVNP